MFKKSIALALGAALVGFAAGPVSAKTLVNGIDANFPPFAYVDKSGTPNGFDVEAVNWIAKEMGLTVEHKPVDWDGIIPNLVAKKIDFICSGMSITEKRAKVVNFTDPYWTVKNLFVVKKGSDLTAEDILKGGKKLGVQQGTSEADWLKENMKAEGYNVTVRNYDSAPMAVEDVLNGRIDAAGMNDAPAKDAVGKKPVQIAGEWGPVTDFGCAVRKQDTELLDTLNAGYKKLLADPFWKELIAKYKP